MKTKDILYKVGKQCMLNDNEMLFLNIDQIKKGKKVCDVPFFQFYVLSFWLQLLSVIESQFSMDFEDSESFSSCI